MKPIIARSATELAEVLGLDPAEGLEFDVQNALNDKIISVARRHNLTHAQIAQRAGTSRTRITAIMNQNLIGVSTDMLIRVLGSLGVHMSVRFSQDRKLPRAASREYGRRLYAEAR